MRQRRALLRCKDPFDTSSNEEQFLRAMAENHRYSRKHCQPYRSICEGLGFDEAQLTHYEDLEKLPVLPTALFKRVRLLNRRLCFKATSSGTSGRASTVGFTFFDLLAELKTVFKIAKLRHLFSPKPCHYIILGYKMHRGNKTGVTKTAFGSTFFAPALSRRYALNYQNGQYQLDLERLLAAVQQHASSRFPTRLIGFPSYMWFLMQLMDERGIHVTLPKGSRILLGGGWKQFYSEEVDKATFYALVRKVLGIDDCDIVEFFGAVEHPILYCDCEKHHFHIPIYSRVIIRDAKTLAPLPNGSVGLVNLLTPMIQATPLLSVMTDDLGVLHDGKDCGCGLRSPYLEILGRVGLKDIKTCAAGAAEFLSEVKL